MSRYSPKAKQIIKKTLKKFTNKQLKHGRTGKKVTNIKQAIAISISEARKRKFKVPKKGGE